MIIRWHTNYVLLTNRLVSRSTERLSKNTDYATPRYLSINEDFYDGRIFKKEILGWTEQSNQARKVNPNHRSTDTVEGYKVTMRKRFISQ